MEHFRADLHIHSRYSRATSRSLNPRNLAAWSRVKGIDVIATGDFTHPGWMQEIEAACEQEDSGLLRLRRPDGLEKQIPWLESPFPSRTPRFMLSAEISSIYKSGDKVRKIHNLVYMPSLDAARRFSGRLAAVGNLASDGRPILGLDAKHLLEMVLETDPRAFLVPAHIWTPWFSLFGSRSGFDSIEECFGDLAREIFALETGLSSDPEMNWLWSRLDRFRLISNSDAHSGENVGREANVFQGAMSYDTILRALNGQGVGQKFLGTIEFFPEEGKYHLDGHRKCNVVMEPGEARARGGLCPVCAKPLTLGVLHRVLELSDRETPRQPDNRPGFTSLIPLAEILSEVVQAGPKTKSVRQVYSRLIGRFGSELAILQRVPIDDLRRISPPLAEGIRRMRSGEVIRRPGFDGEYGRIRMFTENELKGFRRGRVLIQGLNESAEPAAPPAPPRDFSSKAEAAPPDSSSNTFTDTPTDPAAGSTPDDFFRADPLQQEAVEALGPPLLVLAGPGTGKTHTLTARVRLLLEKGIPAAAITVVTFTRRAADELKERLFFLLRRFGDQAVRADTLHALAFDFWRERQGEAPVVLRQEHALAVFRAANPDLDPDVARETLAAIDLHRETETPLPDDLAPAAEHYFRHKSQLNQVDYLDLLEYWRDQILLHDIRECRHLLVDEVQDLSPLQWRIVRLLLPENGQGLFAIGDFRQAVYGFRGAAPLDLAALRTAYPELAVRSLTRNFRSSPDILAAAHALFPEDPPLESDLPRGEVRFFQAANAVQEAGWIGDQVRRLVGGAGHWQQDLGMTGEFPLGEIAVLVRFRGLMPLIRQTLNRLGLPCAAPETEAFWSDRRVEIILDCARSFLGIHKDEHSGPSCPDSVIARGPERLAAYLKDIPPFDSLFWQGKAFLSLQREFGRQGGWVGLINWINLQTDLEQVRLRAEKIQIMTIHAAKGLEFDAVFLPALEEGILPFAGRGFLSGQNLDGGAMDAEEERRLFYVGMTRARSRLFLSTALRRTIFGRKHVLPPSRFLQRLPEEGVARSSMKAVKATRERQLKLV